MGDETAAEVKRNGTGGSFDFVDQLVGSGGNNNFNPAEQFMSPGRVTDANDFNKLVEAVHVLLMKTFVDSRDEAIEIMMFYGRCVELRSKKGLGYLITFLESKASIRGAARAYGLQAIIGAIAPDVLQALSGSAQTSGGKSLMGKVQNHFNNNRQQQEPYQLERR